MAILYDTLVAPFAEFDFMRRALVGVMALALGAGPIGVFLMLRRMSLVGDAGGGGLIKGLTHTAGGGEVVGGQHVGGPAPGHHFTR